jgi:hypothetical protein
MIVKLETTIANLDSVHASITARAKAVAVPIETLNRLLVDHHRMARTLEGLGVKLVNQEPKNG